VSRTQRYSKSSISPIRLRVKRPWFLVASTGAKSRRNERERTLSTVPLQSCKNNRCQESAGLCSQLAVGIQKQFCAGQFLDNLIDGFIIGSPLSFQSIDRDSHSKRRNIVVASKPLCRSIQIASSKDMAKFPSPNSPVSCSLQLSPASRVETLLRPSSSTKLDRFFFTRHFVMLCTLTKGQASRYPCIR